MARTRCGYRNTTGPGLVLAVALRFQNPRAVERRKTNAEPALGATTRARSRRIAAAAAALPEEILAWEIFVRLPARDILHCRAVCRRWRDLTSAPDFILAHHRRQPSLLLTIYRHYSTTGRDPTFKRGHPILRLDDHSRLRIHASCDGLLIVSPWDDRFSICNPVTRQCAPLPCLSPGGYINIAALYLHRPSGEYRVLYWKGRYGGHPKAAYYILTMRHGCSPTCIGVASDNPSIDKDMLAWNASLAQPVVFRNYLHWDQGGDAGILVFDTVVESFRLMRRPAGATKLCTHLCDMEGSIGFSCFGDGKTVAKIWVLEDYDREVWSFKYHVKIPAWCLYNNLEHTQHLVLSHKGDVLVYNRYDHYMVHCDNTGKLLEKFKYDSWNMMLIGPWFKESLVKYDFSRRQGGFWAGQLRFF